MSYPQPNADQYAARAYKFFRLNTPLVSDGDMYQSPQGAQALVIGPDSDIASVNVGYFDDQVSTFLNQITISPERPFVGEFLARNEALYAPAQRPGRLLFWSNNLFNATYRPGAFSDIADRIDFVTPQLDVIQYFQPTSLPAGGRNDKSYYYPLLPLANLPTPAAGSYYLVIPFYGRGYLDFVISNNTNGVGADLPVSVHGLRYIYTDIAGADVSELATGTLGEGDSLTDVLTASEIGFFDAIQFAVTVPGPNPITGIAGMSLRATVSDREV